MPKLLKKPSIIEPAGSGGKIIEEYIGHVNSGDSKTSIAKMTSPQGWAEPGQTPEFDEYTLILKGAIQVKTKDKTFKVESGQALITYAGEWVQYSSPFEGGAEYVAVCLPAFSPDIVHRDED